MVNFLHGINFDEIFKNGNNIFFIETKDNIDSIPGRTICALESAARFNPRLTVHFILDHYPNFAINDAQIRILERIPNLEIIRVNFESFVRDTPIEEIWTQNITKKEGNFLQNISNALRYVRLRLIEPHHFISH